MHDDVINGAKSYVHYCTIITTTSLSRLCLHVDVINGAKSYAHYCTIITKVNL